MAERHLSVIDDVDERAIRPFQGNEDELDSLEVGIRHGLRFSAFLRRTFVGMNKRINKSVDHVNQVLVIDIPVKRCRKQRFLRAVIAFNDSSVDNLGYILIDFNAGISFDKL